MTAPIAPRTAVGLSVSIATVVGYVVGAFILVGWVR
jgi:hypothetical protein